MPVDSVHPDLSDLRAAVERACQPTYAPYILEGRKRVAEMPRQWVLENVEAVGRAALNFADKEWGSWEYGRFLEVLDVIGAHELLGRMVREGLASSEVDVR
jgi:hypothetical protein